MPYHIPPALIIDGTLYTLLFFSIATWTIILFKLWQYGKNGFYNRRYGKAFWNAPNLAAAEQLSQARRRGPFARVSRSGFAWLAEKRAGNGNAIKYQGVPQELLAHTLKLQTQREQSAMEWGLTPLASIGSTAPFVGLFGTVLGIMHALHDISQIGSASLDVVAGPIGDALIATAVGIAVAVPAVLAYNFFLRRAKQHRMALDHFAESFLQCIFSSEIYTGQLYGIQDTIR